MYYCSHCDSSYVITIETDQGPHGLYFIGMDPMEIDNLIGVWNIRDAYFTMAQQALIHAKAKVDSLPNRPYPDNVLLDKPFKKALAMAEDACNIFLFIDH